MTERLLNHAAVRRLVKSLGRVETQEHLDALEREVRQTLIDHCHRRSFGKRLHADLFFQLPAGELR